MKNIADRRSWQSRILVLVFCPWLAIIWVLAAAAQPYSYIGTFYVTPTLFNWWKTLELIKEMSKRNLSQFVINNIPCYTCFHFSFCSFHKINTEDSGYINDKKKFIEFHWDIYRWGMLGRLPIFKSSLFKGILLCNSYDEVKLQVVLFQIHLW